jgi:N-acetylmuramoyl-L-alanine amidase
VVIDAGHGGLDPGARGVSGALEKDLVLQYARELRRQLKASGRYRVVMTRDRDVVLPLRRRVARAEQAEGDLFLSLHANIYKSRGVRGASVYTLSEKASDAEAEALAAKENKADVLSGVSLDGQSEDVSMILIDLAQRETMNLSKDFANTLVRALGDTTRLLPKPHRSAGFAVLKSPTVPSVLVEVGYMSNRREEKLLRSPAHRKKISAALVKAIDNYFKAHSLATKP